MRTYVPEDDEQLSPVVVVATGVILATFAVGLLYRVALLLL